MSRTIKIITLVALLSLLLSTATVFANPESSQDGSRGGPPAPPQEAIDACNGKSSGDKVSFETPHGDTILGVCQEMDGLLFAIPENDQHMKGQRR
jgi:hypothetical protein